MNHNQNSIQKYVLLSLGCLLFALIFSMGEYRKDQEILASRLSPAILRFHILANSDQSEDQQVKLEVRSLILDYIQGRMDQHAGKEETINYLTSHRAEIETLADGYLTQQGFDYQTTLEITNCYFPTRSYDDLSFPSGYYDAARITLGKGDGHNWWCVLYPRFCFVDAACTEVPNESAVILSQVLGQGDYLALQDSRPEIQTRFLLLPFMNP